MHLAKYIFPDSIELLWNVQLGPGPGPVCFEKPSRVFHRRASCGLSSGDGVGMMVMAWGLAVRINHGLPDGYGMVIYNGYGMGMAYDGVYLIVGIVKHNCSSTLCRTPCYAVGDDANGKNFESECANSQGLRGSW